MDDSVCVCSIVKEAVQSISVTQIHESGRDLVDLNSTGGRFITNEVERVSIDHCSLSVDSVPLCGILD